MEKVGVRFRWDFPGKPGVPLFSCALAELHRCPVCNLRFGTYVPFTYDFRRNNPSETLIVKLFYPSLKQ